MICLCYLKVLHVCLCYLKVLHNLSVWTATDKNMDYDKAKETAKSAKKESKLVRKILQNIPKKEASYTYVHMYIKLRVFCI